MPAPLYLRLWTATPWVFRWICTTWTGMAITAMAILGGVLRAAARLLSGDLGSAAIEIGLILGCAAGVFMINRAYWMIVRAPMAPQKSAGGRWLS